MTRLVPTLQDKKIIFLDMDGTIYLGDRLIPGTASFLSALKTEGKRFYFLSNNSSRSKHDYVRKLKNLGIPSSVEDILLSTDGVIDFLLNRHIKRTFVVGTQSMSDMFLKAGFDIKSPNPQYIVLGFDTELNYEKIRTAALLLQKGVPLLATHKDLVCPTEEGPIPDVGAMLALFETATGKKPAKIFGKPNREMLAHVIKKHKADPGDLAIVGDRIYTDREMALHIGCDFILVLSGESGKKEAARLNPQPALTVDTLGQLLTG
jgi:HAD superfamily hydrolase (TIGR01450 family)